MKTARTIPIFVFLSFVLGTACSICNGQTPGNNNPLPPVGNPPVNEQCLVWEGLKSCQNKFNNPGPIQFCAQGQLCDNNWKCPGNQFERRNSGSWALPLDSSRRANKGEAGWLADEKTMVCTATRSCICKNFADEDNWLGNFYCVLGQQSSQINEKEFKFGVSTGNGPCVGK